jgi:nicotinate-nucleotide adenylyltransferase
MLSPENDRAPDVHAATLGVFGGTFDPVHVGHLLLAERAREELGLDRVLFIPAHIPPHKRTATSIVTGEHRARMLELAVASNPSFFVSRHELNRQGISYTVDTLESLQNTEPRPLLWLLIGADNAQDFRSWRDPGRIAELASIAVWRRPGTDLPAELLREFRFRTVRAPLIDISSSEIRARVALDRSIRYLVPEPVADYIECHGLYC